MKAYLITTGTLFGLITMAHVWRMIEEGMELVQQPWYVLLTIVTAAMTVWAFNLLRVLNRRS
jgi:hypothetical protein